MGVLQDIVSNPGKALGSDLTGGNSFVGQAGQAVGICGRQAISNPIVDALAGAALAYFTGGASGLLGMEGLGGITGLGVAANAGLVTGGLVGLSTGNLKTGIMAGLSGWTGASLENYAVGASATPAATSGGTGINTTPGSSGEGFATSPSSNVGTPYAPAQPGGAPSFDPSSSGAGLNPSSASANAVYNSPYTTGGSFDPYNPNYTPNTPYTPVQAPVAAAPQGIMNTIKCAVSSAYAAHPGYTIAAGVGAAALGANALKKAATPNTVAAPQSPNSNVIRQYSYNPYTETYTPISVTNAASFGASGFTPNQSSYQSSYPGSNQYIYPVNHAQGGIVALANGGLASTAQKLADKGRGNDSELLHVTKNELDGLNSINKKMTGSPLPINPHTGLHEACILNNSLADRLNAQLNAQQLNSSNLISATPTGMSTMPICQVAQMTPAQIKNQSANVLSGLTQDQIAAFNPSQLSAYYGVVGYPKILPVETGGVCTTPVTPVKTCVAPAAATATINKPAPIIPPNENGGLICAIPVKTCTAPVVATAPTVQTPTPNQNTTTTTTPVVTTPTPTPTNPNLPTGGGISAPTQVVVQNGGSAPAPVVTPLPTLPSTTTPANPTAGVGGASSAAVAGGGTNINANGSVTTSPVIPGIPAGGFTGINSLITAYQLAGGSLGNPVVSPTTMDQFNSEYNTMTGDSASAYNFLMGKTKQPQVTNASPAFMPYAVAVGASKLGPSGASNAYTNTTPNPYTVPSGATQVKGAVYSANGVNYLSDGTIITPYQGSSGNYVDQYGYIYNSYGVPIGSVPSHANGGLMGFANGGMPSLGHLGGYSDGGRLLRGPGDGVSDSIPATIGSHNPEPARLADGEFVVPARIVSELGNGSTEAGARKLYQMMDRIQKNRAHSVGHDRVAVNSHSDKFLPA